MTEPFKAILLDSLYVLNYPASGHLFIPPAFFDYIKPVNWDHVRDIERHAAFAQAKETLDMYPLVPTKEDEFTVFMDYYATFFRSIPRLKATPEQIEGIARSLVYDPAKFTFFPDALEVIPRLAANYRLAVVSDAWPSLEDVFVHAGLREYFSAFILSSQIGARKPDPRMFHTALDALGITAGEALFVDDNKKNCDGARAMGLRTALLCRDPLVHLYFRLTCKTHRVIRSLAELVD
ncbi:haloacid dehalogenase (plasmid) [Leptolinea sp. HRD-7]|nr:haloacid dehalogenase [Leptolinea sp. HRD-7]